MKTKPLLTRQNIEYLASRLLEWIYANIKNKEPEEFIRETNICWNIQFSDNILLNRESVNEIFFYVNEKFGSDPSFIKYDYMETQSPKPQGKERIFDFRYGNSMEDFAKFVNFINNDYTDKLSVEKTKITYKHINCLVQEVQYLDIFIMCELKSNSIFTDNRIFVYNSFYTNLENDETIQILPEDYKMLHIGGREVYYKVKEFSEYETTLIARFLPNTINNQEGFKKYEFYECPKCGEELSKSEEYCQTCGFEIGENTVCKDDQLVQINNQDLTICQITFKEDLNNYTFATLRIETTPDCTNNEDREFGWFSEPLNTYYVFKKKLHHLNVGQQLNLNLKDFELFHTLNHFSVYYNKYDFTDDEISDLKTYKIN